MTTFRQRRLQLLIYSHWSDIASKSFEAALLRIDDNLWPRRRRDKETISFSGAVSAYIALVTFDLS